MINRLSLLKSRKQHRLIQFFILFIFLTIITIYFVNQHKSKIYIPPRTWEEIKKTNNLKVGILYNYTDYFVLRGKIYGFHYDMINEMGKQLGLHIEYKVYNNYKEYYDALLNNEIDILAVDAVPTYHSQLLFDYTFPHSYSSLVLVQNKKKSFSQDTIVKTNQPNYLIIPASLAYIENKDFIKEHSFILQKSSLFSEQIIKEVNNGNINRTIAYYKNINANIIFFNHINYSYVSTEEQSLHWIIRKHNDSLLFFVNQWLTDFTSKQQYTLLLKKYYHSSSYIHTLFTYTQNYSPFGTISPYDKIIEKYATKYQLDWLLVTSLIYQESKFHENINGKNTWGLMQFMPNTANYLGVNINDSPQMQIKAGCRYLKLLQDKYIKLGVKDSLELMKFILAAYNAGSCRIESARKLAKVYGLNENKWENNVAVALTMLSKQNIQQNLYLKCNKYSQADHTIRYVEEIIHRYHHYKNIANYTFLE